MQAEGVAPLRGVLKCVRESPSLYSLLRLAHKSRATSKLSRCHLVLIEKLLLRVTSFRMYNR